MEKKLVASKEMNMAEEPLTERQRAYLYVIYQLHCSRTQILSAEIARKLSVSKPSVASMLEVFEKKGLITKKHYGRVQMTDQGLTLARQLESYMNELVRVIPKMGLELRPEELQSCAWELFRSLPHSVLDKLPARV